MRRITSALFLAGLVVLMAAIYQPMNLVVTPLAGDAINASAGQQVGADLFFPLLLVVGLYIILHGHLTPGGGFQGGVVLAAAFFIPVLARPGTTLDYHTVSLI
jgi:multisubunit Na+/H+ antiporter MnhB subunit